MKKKKRKKITILRLKTNWMSSQSSKTAASGSSGTSTTPKTVLSCHRCNQ